MSWAAQNYLDYHWLLAVKESLTQSPEPIKRFLRALVKAEEFLLAHEDEAKGIVTRKLSLDPGFMQQVWDKTTLNVTLNQSLLTSLDNFARWKMNKEGKPGDLPNFLNYIYTGALDEVDPQGGYDLQVGIYADTVQDLGKHRRLRGGFGGRRLFCVLHPAGHKRRPCPRPEIQRGHQQSLCPESPDRHLQGGIGPARHAADRRRTQES